jgi:hypothetical protein
MPANTAKAADTPPKGNLVEVTVPMPTDSGATTAQTALAYAENFKIATADDYTKAAEAAGRASARFEAIDAEREKLKAPSLEACRRTDAFFKPALTALKAAKDILRGKMSAWDKQQDEIRKDQQRKADEMARIERERLQREAAETQRLADEKAAAVRRQAEEARKAGDLAGAQKLEQRAGRTEDRAAAKVANLEAAAISAVAPIIQTEIPKVQGVARKRVWKFRVDDASKLPREFLMPDEKKLTGYVRAMKGDARIPGITVWDEPDTAVSKGAT